MRRRTGRDSATARTIRKFRRGQPSQKPLFGKRRAVEGLEQRVLLLATPTSIAVSASSSSVVYGQAVTLTANVSASPSAPSEGTVDFFDNGAPLATAPVSSGVATLDNVHLPVGAELITASYSDPGGSFGSSSTAIGPNTTIETVAGGALQNGLQAIGASISPQAVAVDSSGDLFIADDTLNVVFEVNHGTGVATIVAGNGTPGFSGDGGPATAAELAASQGVAVDSSGHLFIADPYNNRVREVDLATGVISTVAGNGTWGFSGDGGPATAARIGGPTSVAVDSSGELFIADSSNNRIREVNLATGIITTVAGDGTQGFSGDGGPAAAAELYNPQGVAVDSSGDLIIADTYNNRIREVNHATGTITTVAGNGTLGLNGDGGPATAAELFSPEGIAVDTSGDVFFVDDNLVREVNHATGVITTVAGSLTLGFSGDGGPAAAAELNGAVDVAVDSSGNLFIADKDNNRVREVNQATGIIATVAGNGTRAFSGDGGPATAAQVDWPRNIAVDSSGDLFIADASNNRIREVNHATGLVTTVAGNGTAGFSGDFGPATAAELNNPQGIAVDSSGELFIADSSNNRIREVNLATGVITTVAGYGAFGFSGDGGPATAAQLSYPRGVTLDSAGDLFFTDPFNNRVHEVNHSTGIITTVAGNGTSGFSGDGGPATAAELNNPEGIAVDLSGDLFIADGFNNRVREVNLATGIITTVAGSATQGSSGDGGPATAAQLHIPTGLAVDSSGDLFIAETGSYRVRQVNLATGIITAVAGNGTAGFSGDGGPAAAAELSVPVGIGFDPAGDLAVDPAGDLFIADTGNNRIREMAKGATAVVNVTQPFVVNDAVYTIGSGVVSVSAADGLLKGDTGPSPLTVTAGTVTGTEGGTFVFHADGSFTYTPADKFPGFDYAQFTVTDAQGDQGTATVNVLSQAGGVVWKFYEQVLDRAPDYGGLQHWINDFVHGGATGDIAAGFFESDELLNEIITGYYQQYLLRTPDASGLAYWKQVWRATGGPETIKAGFADSPEFYASAGVTPQAWVAELYHRVLGRDPDPEGDQFWLNYLTSHGNTAATRYNIALDFFTSLETDKADVTGWFQEYLERAPTASELDQYAGEMQAGKTDRDIEQEIANLPEYGQNPPAPAAGTAERLPDYNQPSAATNGQQAKDSVFSKLGG